MGRENTVTIPAASPIDAERPSAEWMAVYVAKIKSVLPCLCGDEGDSFMHSMHIAGCPAHYRNDLLAFVRAELAAVTRERDEYKMMTSERVQTLHNKLATAERERDELFTRVNAKDCSQYHTTDAVLEEKAKREAAEQRCKALEDAVRAALAWMVPVLGGFGLEAERHVTVKALRAALSPTPPGDVIAKVGKTGE